MISFIKGASYPIRGLRWLTRPGLRRYVIIPLLVNTVLFSGLIYWGYGQFDQLMIALVAWLPDWLDWLSWLLWPLFALTALLLSFYTFTLVANLIASPFNGLLSEHTEDLVSPVNNRPAGRPLWQEAVLAPLTELRKLAYFIGWAIPLLLLTLVPGLNVVAPLLWMGFTAWMLALQYMDYPLGNYLIAFRRQRAILAERRLLALGFGAAALVMTLIPVVNFLAMPSCVIGATLMWVEQFPRIRRSGSAGPPLR